MMRTAILVAGLFALGGCAGGGMVGNPQSVPLRNVAADRAAIAALEADWSRAFLARDYDRIEQIVAPEYKLVSWRADGFSSTGRAEWMANLRKMDFKTYETKLLDVVVVDDTAVATLSGNWIVGIDGKFRPNTRFLVADTWVRRGGQWQVILRHSQRLD